MLPRNMTTALGLAKWLMTPPPSTSASHPSLPQPPKTVTQIAHEISKLHRAHKDFGAFQTKMERLLTKLVDIRASPARQDLVKREFLVRLSRKVNPDTNLSDQIRDIWNDDTPGLFASTEKFGWLEMLLVRVAAWEAVAKISDAEALYDKYINQGQGKRDLPFNQFKNKNRIPLSWGITALSALAGKRATKTTASRFKQLVHQQDRQTRVSRKRRFSASRSRSRSTKP